MLIRYDDGEDSDDKTINPIKRKNYSSDHLFNNMVPHFGLHGMERM